METRGALSLAGRSRPLPPPREGQQSARTMRESCRLGWHPADAAGGRKGRAGGEEPQAESGEVSATADS